MSKPCYTKQHVGGNKLIPSLSVESKCETKYVYKPFLICYSCHKNVAGSAPEKLVAEKSGHRSLKALRSYERTDTRMQMAIDAVISNATSNAQESDDEQEAELAKTVSDEILPDKDVSTAANPSSPVGHTFSGVMNNCTI